MGPKKNFCEVLRQSTVKTDLKTHFKDINFGKEYFSEELRQSTVKIDSKNHLEHKNFSDQK